MLRRIIIEIILFAFPFIAYFGGRALARAFKPDLELPPYTAHMRQLIAAGAAMAVLGFLLTVAFEPRHVDQAYTPAHLEDGEVVPGVFTDPAAAPKDQPVLTPLQKAAQEREAQEAKNAPKDPKADAPDAARDLLGPPRP